MRYVTEQSFLVIQFPPELLSQLNEFKPVLSILSRSPLIRYDPDLAEHNEIISCLSRIRVLNESDVLFREVSISRKTARSS